MAIYSEYMPFTPDQPRPFNAEVEWSYDSYSQHQEVPNYDSYSHSKEAETSVCWSFANKGFCHRGSACRWRHDAMACNEPVADCKSFPFPEDQAIVKSCNEGQACWAWMNKGWCPRGDMCCWPHPILAPQDATMQQFQQCSVDAEDSNAANVDIWAVLLQDVDRVNAGLLEPLAKSKSPTIRQSPHFCTDGDIAAKPGDKPQNGRQLKKWNGAIGKDAEEVLEANGKCTEWDQFRRNEERFGVTSTFAEDLSQYTTPLDLSKVPSEVKARAEKIAREVESQKPRCNDDENTGDANDDDEEALFSSVPRKKEAAPCKVKDLAAVIGGCAPCVQTGVWALREEAAADLATRLRDISGGTALRCAFCRADLGEGSQAVAHLTAAMPRGLTHSSPCPKGTQHLRGVGLAQSWPEFQQRWNLQGSTICPKIWPHLQKKVVSDQDEAPTVGQVLEALRTLSFENDPEAVVERHGLVELLTVYLGLTLLDLERDFPGLLDELAEDAKQQKT